MTEDPAPYFVPSVRLAARGDCLFCTIPLERIVFHDAKVFCIWDAYPASPGHALLITRRHVATWFDASEDEQFALGSAIQAAKREIERKHRPSGYNVGFNVGEAAGQTVFHLHVHVIQRYSGDVLEPRGGIRGVIPGKASY